MGPVDPRPDGPRPGPETGDRLSRDKDVAWDKLTAARKRLAMGEVVQSVPTVKDMERRVARPDRRPRQAGRTVDAPLPTLTWIIPSIGREAARPADPGDVRAVQTALDEAGREPATKRNVHSTLMTMLNAAVVEGHPVPRPVLAVRKPAAGVATRDSIPVDGALRLVQVIGTEPDAARWWQRCLRAAAGANASE